MLDALAIERDRSKSYLVREALRAYLDKYFRDYRDKHIRESIKKGKDDD
jgi:predicted transcriptional regulator